MSKKLDCALDIANRITRDYPQKWGDCYKVNSTVKYFLNKHFDGYPFARLWQITAELDREIPDSIGPNDEEMLTDEVSHVVLTVGKISKGAMLAIGMQDEVPDYEDFSRVFKGEHAAEITSVRIDDELGGSEPDRTLLAALEKEFKKSCGGK
jgi:hypothetical protein